MPVRLHRSAHGEDRLRSTDTNQKNEDGGDRERRCRMHHDTKRAMIAVGIDRMNVRHLHDGKHRKQDQAHDRGNARCARFLAATAAGSGKQSCQEQGGPLPLTIHRLDVRGVREDIENTGF
jgi:hypothetical protein